MQMAFNPKDANTFASCSLDKTIKVWGLTSSQAHFSLEGHERGVNCVDYYQGGDKPCVAAPARWIGPAGSSPCPPCEAPNSLRPHAHQLPGFWLRR